MSTVRTRFAPSPTGYLHIGGARTALFNWLYARHTGGTFVLRIEDTDTARSTQESVQAILDGMSWLGLDWDEGPFYQTERMDSYRAAADRLLADGRAYYCSCSPEELQAERDRAMKEGRKPTYNRKCRDAGLRPTPEKPLALRFKAPLEGETVLDDAIRGTITFRNEELDDLVIVRTDGVPTYNFAVVIDDVDMRITHIIRGDDHINNTPRQIQIYKALGYELPVFGHVPMILGSDKTRLSKRHGATSVIAYKEMGFVNEALVNYLVRLGWSHGDQEIFSMQEMIGKFNMEQIGRSPSVFNPEKLLWLNAHYIKEMSLPKLAEMAWEYFAPKGFPRPAQETLERIVGSLQQRSRDFVEMVAMGSFYFTPSFEYEEAGAKKFFSADAADAMDEVATLLATEELTETALEAMARSVADRRGMKLVALAQPLRLALTGRTVSPSVFEIIGILGRDESIARIRRAVARIRS